jgi:hypothetical protein
MKKINTKNASRLELQKALNQFRKDGNPEKGWSVLRVLRHLAYFIELLIAFLNFSKNS